MPYEYEGASYLQALLFFVQANFALALVKNHDKDLFSIVHKVKEMTKICLHYSSGACDQRRKNNIYIWKTTSHDKTFIDV